MGRTREARLSTMGDQEQMLKYAKSRAIAPNGLCTEWRSYKAPPDPTYIVKVRKFEEGLVFKLFGAA
jgi:hypothetical protein